jgi:phosphopantetheinyl transferase
MTPAPAASWPPQATHAALAAPWIAQAPWLAQAQPVAMQPGVCVWALALPDAPPATQAWLTQAQAAWAWLSGPEHQRCERQHLPALRLQHLATHLLLRYALAQQQASVAPQAWQLSYAAQGAPMLSGPPGVSAPSVSLSRSQGMVVCALADASLALGIDVEWVNPALPDLPELARATLTPREQALWQLRDAEGSMQAQRWFRVWCAKEAHTKARGHGLLRPVVDYEIWPDGTAALACSPGPSLAQIHDRAYPPPPHAAAWPLHLHLLPSGHLLACTAQQR